MFGSLIIHEMMIGEDPSKKKKATVFRASMESDEELDDEELALISRKFKCFLIEIQMRKKKEEEKEKLAMKGHPT